MGNKPTKILLIEDNAGDARLIQEMLWAEGQEATFDMVVADRLSTGLAQLVHTQAPSVPIVVLTGPKDETLGIKAVQKGAQDYLPKRQIDANLLVRTIRYAIERRKIELKLKEAIEIKSQFISKASHKLRNLLTAINEGLRLVLDEVTGKLNDDQKEFLDMAKRNVDRLAGLINDVLDFLKLDADKMKFDISENDMNEAVREVKETMAPLAKEKGLNLIASLDETLPVVRFDKDKMIQVLANLVDNAVKFTEKGSITITTAKGDSDICVSVQDTGAGIRKEDLPRLFDEFAHLSDGKDRKTGGTGLGLAIVKKIVTMHNGRIEVESEVGSGATFTFFLPLAVEPVREVLSAKMGELLEDTCANN